MARGLVIVGLAIAGVGALMMLGVPFGRLPGDLVFRRGPVTFAVPVVTCIVLSVVISLLLSWFRR